ncbi:HAMP domain-containing protein, partial [Candidatus Pacearchaeota archaeon]|nr:HAMP domain-containing protein [Candidatus Pacearchaeota archaeon]
MKISIKIFLSIFIIIILIGFIAYITLSNYLNTITGNIISNLSINNSKSNNYNSINWTIFIFLSGLTLITSSLMISRSITKPLKKLQEQTKEIGISHLVKKIDFNSNDEIGDLA